MLFSLLKIERAGGIVNIEMGVLFGAIGTIVGIIGAITVMKKDSRADGESAAQTKTKLDYISKGVDDIRIDQRAQATKLELFNEKLIRVEESTKQAHKRINEITKEEV